MRSTSPDSWGSFIVGFLECPPAAPGIAVPHPPARPRAVSLPPASLLAQARDLSSHRHLPIRSSPPRPPRTHRCVRSCQIADAQAMRVGCMHHGIDASLDRSSIRTGSSDRPYLPWREPAGSSPGTADPANRHRQATKSRQGKSELDSVTSSWSTTTNHKLAKSIPRAIFSISSFVQHRILRAGTQARVRQSKHMGMESNRSILLAPPGTRVSRGIFSIFPGASDCRGPSSLVEAPIGETGTRLPP